MCTIDLLGIVLASTLYISLATATITLGQFQEVTGFPTACLNAYNAPISGCDASNFPQKCSSACFYALEQAEALIDNSCAGQQAPFNSIIGQMFEGNGPTFMCTSDFNLQSSGGSSYYTDATTLPSSTTISSTTAPTSSISTSRVTTTTESSSSTKSKFTSTTSSTVHRTSTVVESTSSASSASSSTSSSTSTSSQSSTSKPPSTATFLSTAFNNGQATTLTSQAQRTSAANSNPDAFGGGGSPFEVGANENGGEKATADFWLLLSVVFGVVLVR